MRIYESIVNGKRRYHRGAQDATTHVGGKRAPDHEVAAIDTAEIPTKGLLIAALNGEEWIGSREVLHSKGKARISTGLPGLDKALEPGFPAGAFSEPLPPSAPVAPVEPSDFPRGVQAAFHAVLIRLRALQPGGTLGPADCAYLELALDPLAGCCGQSAMGAERKAALTKVWEASLPKES